MSQASVDAGRWSFKLPDLRVARRSRAGAMREVSARSSESTSKPLAQMQVLRAAFLVVVIWSGIGGPVKTSTELRMVLTYGGIVLAGEVLRRLWSFLNGPLVTSLLFADVLFLFWTLYVGGGTLSPLRFLVYLHLIATTLVYSYRAGLVVALMHSGLLVILFQAQGGDAFGLSPMEGPAQFGEGIMSIRESWVFSTLVYWLLILATAPFSSINERELRRRKSDLGVLANMADELENLRDPREIADAALDKVCETFPFGRGVVLLVEDDRLVLMASRGTSTEVVTSSRLDDVINAAWDEKDPVLVAKLDEATDPVLSSLMPFGANLLVAPMFADGQPIGVFVVESEDREETVIQRRIIAMVMQFASHAALAMRKATLIQKVQTLADTDALTGLANRRTFETALERGIARSIRTGEEMTLIMLDLDNFKALNDRFGHQAGDAVLRNVGATLCRVCRDFDTPSRYGGEEFAILLPGCRRDQAMVAADRLRAWISRIQAPVDITASAGVAVYPINAKNGTDLVATADEALYESKRAGRNRATMSSQRPLRVVTSEAS